MLRQCRRFISSSGARSLRTWPHIERKPVSESIKSLTRSRSNSILYLSGGRGAGKTESVYRTIDKIRNSHENGQYLIVVLDFKELIRVSADSNHSSLLTKVIRALSSQLAQQVSPSELFDLLNKECADFESNFRDFVSTRPLWAHQMKGAKTVSEIWTKLMTSQSIAAESLSQIKLSANPQAEIETYTRILKSCGKSVSVCLLHTDLAPAGLLDLKNRKGTLIPLTQFNLLVECDDSLSNIYNICSSPCNRDHSILEIEDLPKEAVKAIFVPNLLSDDVHVDGLFSVIGGRLGLLEKFFVPLTVLNEEQKLADMDQEQRYRAGKENRPSAESKELQVDPLVHKREVTIRDSSIDGVLKAETELFEDSIDRAVNQCSPLVEISKSMSENEFRAFVIESIRGIVDKVNRYGSLPLPAQLSPMDIAHPVVLALLKENILMMKWKPHARIVAESPLKLFQLDAWCTSQLESLSTPAIMAYNLVLMKNRLHINKQLEKLSR